MIPCDTFCSAFAFRADRASEMPSREGCGARRRLEPAGNLLRLMQLLHGNSRIFVVSFMVASGNWAVSTGPIRWPVPASTSWHHLKTPA
jgi:hypothetical protein